MGTRRNCCKLAQGSKAAMPTHQMPPHDANSAHAPLRPHRPGDLGFVVHRHAVLYHQEYGFDASFEALVARVVADFIDGYDAARDCALIAEIDGRIAGSAFVVRKSDTIAKLRLVYLEPWARGSGLGRRLVEDCMEFARTAGYDRMTLWTQDVLVPARRLYAGLGFQLTSAEPLKAFGCEMMAETWERDL